jgi:hypothetical protein
MKSVVAVKADTSVAAAIGLDGGAQRVFLYRSGSRVPYPHYAGNSASRVPTVSDTRLSSFQA